jgi:hypothetical protein
VETTFGDDFTFKTIVGYNVNSISSRNIRIRTNNLSIANFYDVSNGTGTPSFVNQEENRNFGAYGDFNLGFKTIYFKFLW